MKNNNILKGFLIPTIDKAGSDCGTTKTIKVFITDANKSNFYYSYILDGDNLVCLSPDIIPNYINREVNLRSAILCKGKFICNKCIGELPYLDT